MFASTSTSIITILTTMSLFITDTTALPTRRALARPHHQRRAVAAPFEQHQRRAETGTAMGDHSIVVDASAGDASTSGSGIKNSTINLTVISRRSPLEESTFSRIARALFGRRSSPTSSPVITTQAQQQRKPLGVHSHSKRLHAGKVIRRSQRSNKPAARRVERALMVTDMAEQQSIYQAAVAALAKPTPSTVSQSFGTDQPIVKLAVSTSTAPSSSSAIVDEPIISSTLIANPKISSTVSLEPELEPITLTMTLVANPTAPTQYINAAAIPSSSSSSSFSASRILENASAELAASTASSSSAGFRKAKRSPVQQHRRRAAAQEHATIKEPVGVWLPYVQPGTQA